jgi:ATP-dependent RNA circularization protein (DNA/RNA ligase family)
MENNFVTKEEGNRRTKHVRLALMNQWNINHVKSVAAAKRMFVIQMRMHTIIESLPRLSGPNYQAPANLN